MARQRTRRRLVTWSALGMLIAALVVGGLVATRGAPSARADAFTGCSGKQLTSAQTTASGYTLSVSVVGQFGVGGDFGTGYCGSVKTVATLSVPASGAGGTLTVTLVGSNTGSVSNSFSFPNASASGGYSFTETSPSAGPKCASGTATFTSSTGLVLSATTKSVCPK